MGLRIADAENWEGRASVRLSINRISESLGKVRLDNATGIEPYLFAALVEVVKTLDLIMEDHD